VLVVLIHLPCRNIGVAAGKREPDFAVWDVLEIFFLKKVVVCKKNCTFAF